MSDYVGITIGPIFETLQLAETPAALWYASSCFSELTRLLLREITRQLPDAVIIAPHYDGARYTDGIGRYHDRILLETDSAHKLDAVVTAAKDAIVSMVLSDIAPPESKQTAFRDYLSHYFQIHYVTVPKEHCACQNILLELSPLLDAIECMPRCNPSRASHPFRALFSSKSDDATSRNSRIKASALLKDVTDSQLFNGSKHLKSIGDICYGAPHFKKGSYFAIVSADGDGMSGFFSGMDNAAVTEASRSCFAYAEAAAAEIRKFGGMTVYAGGDDLLFLAPVQSADGETVFQFCHRLSKLFSQAVAKGKPTPTASFGIAIRYAQFPLYETLNAAYGALESAKRSRPEKNAIAIDLQKHSGQSMKLCIADEGFALFDSILSQILLQSDETVNSIIYVLDRFASSVKVETNDLRTKNINVFINNYDNESQAKYRKYIEAIAGLFCDHLEHSGYITSSESSDAVKCFEQILRIGKFLVERGSEHA